MTSIESDEKRVFEDRLSLTPSALRFSTAAVARALRGLTHPCLAQSVRRAAQR
jgi:hypothetical protein